MNFKSDNQPSRFSHLEAPILKLGAPRLLGCLEFLLVGSTPRQSRGLWSNGACSLQIDPALPISATGFVVQDVNQGHANLRLHNMITFLLPRNKTIIYTVYKPFLWFSVQPQSCSTPQARLLVPVFIASSVLRPRSTLLGLCFFGMALGLLLVLVVFGGLLLLIALHLDFPLCIFEFSCRKAFLYSIRTIIRFSPCQRRRSVRSGGSAGWLWPSKDAPAKSSWVSAWPRPTTWSVLCLQMNQPSEGVLFLFERRSSYSYILVVILLVDC